MQKIFLFNTLGRKKDEFLPIDNSEVRMYSCGPTVYYDLHIGNLRAYVFADTVKRVLQYNGYRVKHVMNVTDVGHLTSDADEGDDKMVKALKREGKPMTIEAMREIADKYFAKAKEDMDRLGILPADHYPFATDHIKEMIMMIQTLLDKDYAYKTSNTIYFDTKSVQYGKLVKASTSDEHSRIGTDPDKRNSEDFALWKLSDTEIGFDAPFGKGFPGWHIECSAMSEKYLGVPFDIHTGGIDHIPVHHNNEIAQTEAATGRLLANYWLHNAHLTIGEEKMAKSGDNFITLSVLEKEGIEPLAYRYWLLTARYSTRMDFSIEAIKAAQTAYRKLRSTEALKYEKGEVNQEYRNKFTNAVNDDLDTPKALAIVWEMIKDQEVSDADKKATLLDLDRVLGLELSKTTEIDLPEKVLALLSERNLAKVEKDYERSDKLREEIAKLGFEVKDTKTGQSVVPLN